MSTSAGVQSLTNSLCVKKKKSLVKKHKQYFQSIKSSVPGGVFHRIPLANCEPLKCDFALKKKKRLGKMPFK